MGDVGMGVTLIDRSKAQHLIPRVLWSCRDGTEDGFDGVQDVLEG